MFLITFRHTYDLYK